MGWTCSHQRGQMCSLLKIVCTPGAKGCTLYGKARFADPSTPSNQAFERKEHLQTQNRQEQKALIEAARKGL